MWQLRHSPFPFSSCLWNPVGGSRWQHTSVSTYGISNAGASVAIGCHPAQQCHVSLIRPRKLNACWELYDLLSYLSTLTFDHPESTRVVGNTLFQLPVFLTEIHATKYNHECLPPTYPSAQAFNRLFSNKEQTAAGLLRLPLLVLSSGAVGIESLPSSMWLPLRGVPQLIIDNLSKFTECQD